VTTGVWARGILQDEYGVDLSRITWVLSGDEHVAEYRPPANVVPLAAGGDLAEQVRAGDLAAGIGLNASPPGLETLIPAAEEAGYEALRRSGLYPINHLVVVRDELLAQHPDLAGSLFEAYAAEVAPFGIHVTLIEPQGYDTDWSGSSSRRAEPLPAYADVHAATDAERKNRWKQGDPEASSAAVLKVVDADEPPLRVFFGEAALGLAKADYEQRLRTWEQWQSVAELAQG